MASRRTHLPYRGDLKLKARALRARMTAPEQKLWFQFLRGFPHPVLRQKPIADYIVDFYCSRLRLVIEIDGDSHFDQDAIAYDARRTDVIGKLGLRVMRFTNLEVMTEFDAVCERIRRESD
jgi:very-short-patch-repair endonuclease